MGYAYMKNTEIGEALKLYLDEIVALCSFPGNEEINVQDSLGRYTAQAIFAHISAPHYNSCAMDGIAVRAKDTFGATDTTPVFLKELKDFIRVDTGDKLPEEFDCVVMIEEVVETGDGTVKLVTAASPWQHVRQIGEDMCAGEMILPSNTLIEPATIGAMLAAGVLKATVKRKPVVALIPTGNEIVKPAADVKPGQIIEFNSAVFSAMFKQWNVDTKVFDIVPDDPVIIKDSIVKACEQCDLVVINAGSSAGRKDFAAGAIAKAGKVIAHGIAIRPGKPTILGIVANKPVVGVPGYPVSGVIVLEKIVKPVIDFLTSNEHVKRATVSAVLSRRVVSSLKYAEFIRVKLGEVNGKTIATPLNRGAGIITSLVKADGLMEIPLNEEGLEAGSLIDIELYKRYEEIRNTVVVSGSHDFLIDAVSDIMKRKHSKYSLSSSHVGSMGGVMAIKRGEAHMAGIHLLDENTGEYNTPYVRKYFSDRNIALIKCVRRSQGLLVANGNPKGIKCLSDLSDKSVKYVNRQKGSGTRVLFDFLLKKEGIDPQSIEGYDRESFTHISVATLIASNSADAGLGVYTAAKVYGLDFIPICDEEYDFIVPEEFLNLDRITFFIDILKSAEFRRALDFMGGYSVCDPGEIVRIKYHA